MARDPAAATLALVFLASLAILVLILAGRRYAVAVIALVAFGLRLARGIDVQISGYVSDALQYDSFAVELARHWQNAGPDPGSWIGKDGFPTLLAVIYSTIGHAPEVGYLLNAFAGGLTVVVTAATVRQMGWHPAIRPAAWLVALWPVGVLWGGQLLREAIVTLLLAVGLWGTVCIYKQRYLSGILTIFAAGVIMIPMRGGLAILILVCMPVTAAIAANVRLRLNPPTLMIATLIAGASYLALQFLADYFDGTRYFEYRPDVIADQNVGNSSFGEAGIGGNAVGPSLGGHLIRTALTAFGPFPWQVTNPSLALAGIDALLWIGIWVAAAYAVRFMRERAAALLFVVPAIALIVYLAANSSNFGLIIRLRGLSLVIIAPLVAMGWVAWRQRRREKREAEHSRPAGHRPPIPSLVDLQAPAPPQRSAELEEILR